MALPLSSFTRNEASQLKAQYKSTWLQDEVDQCISCLKGLVSLEKELEPATLLELSEALGDRYRFTGEPELLEEQVSLCHTALSLVETRDNCQLTMQAEIAFGEALRSRYMHSGHMEDLTRALEIHQSAASRLSSANPDWALVMYHMGSELFLRHSRFAEKDDINQAVEHLQSAVHHTKTSESHYFLAQYFLAMSLWMRYRATGEQSNLEEALTIYRSIVDLAPAHHPDRWLACNGLSSAICISPTAANDIDCLNEALHYARRAFDTLSPVNPNRIRPAINLILLLDRGFSIFGRHENLDEGVNVGRQCLPLSHNLRPAMIKQLASILLARFSMFCDDDDLDESITLFREIEASWGHDHPLHKYHIHDLAHALFRRYRRDRHTEDLTEAIDLLRNSSGMGYGAHDDGSHHDCLAYALTRYAEDREDREAAEEAVALCEYAARLCAKKNFSSIQLSHRYARALWVRYKFRANPQDLDDAIATANKALSHPQMQPHLRQETTLVIAEALACRFELTRASRSDRIHDAQRAWEILTNRIRSLPKEHIDQTALLLRLSHLYLIPGTAFYSIENALQAARAALSDTLHSPQDRLQRSLVLLARLEHVSKLPACTTRQQEMILALYVLTINLLPRVAYCGLEMTRQLRALTNSNELACNGAIQALSLFLPKTAVELLEQGRAVFWSQYLRLRTAFGSIPPDLANELNQIAASLERQTCLAALQDSDQKISDEQTKALQDQDTVNRRRLSERFDFLVQQARELPGLERFMLPERFEALARAAARGPIAIFLADSSACYAIVIENPSTIHQVTLSELSLQELSGLAQDMSGAVHRRRNAMRSRAIKVTLRGRGRTEDVLHDLWTKVVQQIVHSLRLRKATLGSRKRIWFCPTGPFVHLPLHAAGTFSKAPSDPIECLSDFAVASYTPTIGALLNAQRPVPSGAIKNTLLLAAVSSPSKWPRLSFIGQEIAQVQRSLPSEVALNFLGDIETEALKPRAAPTVEAVIKELPKAAVLHLACHGQQHPERPLDSGFALKDGMLTIAKLMSLKLDNAHLAILSACETAKGDRNQPDQAIHLAAAMLFAGFRSVVGTMWAMDDVDGPVVAEAVYSEIFRPESISLDPDAIPYALDVAMQKLRANGVSANRWAPYVHLGA